jgi:hypothetical protein
MEVEAPRPNHLNRSGNIIELKAICAVLENAFFHSLESMGLITGCVLLRAHPHPNVSTSKG